MNAEAVIIVGGAGFIGSSLAERFKDTYDVVITDNLLTGDRNNIKGTEAVFTTLEMPKAVKSFTKKPLAGVFFFGGRSSVTLFDSVRDVGEDLLTFSRWLKFATDNDVPFIYASTSSFYKEYPSGEESGIVAKTHYESAKVAMEVLAKAEYETNGTRAIGLRFFSVYGKRERHKKRLANLISQAIWADDRGIPFEIYGEGSQTRDFTYIEDLLDGIALVFDRGEAGVYNIGYGEEIPVIDMVKFVKEQTGDELSYSFIETPIKNYVTRTSADSSKIRELGWAPKYNYRAGIKHLLEHR